MSLRRHQPLTSDPHRQRAMRERGARRYEERLRAEGRRVRAIGTNEARRRRERERAYGPEARRRFVRSLPCLVCRKAPVDQAHVEGGGMGRKADAEKVVPLCRDHHRQAHEIGHQSFEALHGLDLQAEARKVEEAWQARGT